MPAVPLSTSSTPRRIIPLPKSRVYIPTTDIDGQVTSFPPFPLELHTHIAFQSDQRALYMCCLVSKTFLRIYGKVLYTHLFVSGTDALNLLCRSPVSLYGLPWSGLWS